MGAGFAFTIWVTHTGAEAVGRFSFRHDITGAYIWQFALVLMAYSEVLSHIRVRPFRRIRSVPRTAGLPARTAPTIHVPWPVRPYERS